MSYAETVDETLATLREVAAGHELEVGRSGSYDVIVVGGSGETTSPVPETVFEAARDAGLQVTGVEVDDPTGRPQVGLEFVDPPERGDG